MVADKARRNGLLDAGGRVALRECMPGNSRLETHNCKVTTSLRNVAAARVTLRYVTSFNRRREDPGVIDFVLPRPVVVVAVAALGRRFDVIAGVTRNEIMKLRYIGCLSRKLSCRRQLGSIDQSCELSAAGQYRVD